MSDLLPFIVVGIVTGAVYGLTATGLVLTYKTSGIFNFAQGSIAAWRPSPSTSSTSITTGRGR